MNHFYKGLSGQNWFTCENLFSEFVSRCPNNGSIVEIGCWKGRSSAFLVVEAINSNKNIKLFCVDIWEKYGDVEGIKDPDIENGVIYDVFLKNMEPVKDHFTPIRLPSVEASKRFEDNSLDIVFVDASHEKADVCNDISAWLPKVKPSGILAGHDVDDKGVKDALKETGLSFKKYGAEMCWVHEKIRG